MTQRVPHDQAVRMAADGATVMFLQIRCLPQEPDWCLGSIEVLSQDVEMNEGVVDLICQEERMTRKGADQRAEETAKDYGAVAISVSEVGIAEQQG